MVASPHYADGHFHNTRPVGAGLHGNPLPIFGEYFFARNNRVPRRALALQNPLPTWGRAADSGLRVTWLGHSTVLLELDGVRVLTDPVFGLRASPVSFIGPKRFHPPPVSIAQLPALDAVLVSHDHYDHLCAESVCELAARDVPFVTSLGVGAHLERFGVPPQRIHELDWWESATFKGGTLRFTAAPAQHFSGRGVTDRNETLWSSWHIKTDHRSIFFSGDTGLTDEFREVGARLGPFDLVMIEIGAWHPAWGDIHLGPQNALAAHKLLGSGAFMPVHWSTFNLALHDWNEPAETLWQLAEKDGTRLFLPRLGAPLEPSQVDTPLPWWRAV
jgi:L-ascorbate metabolism protein UlaG (beta-lactamase superfamily)